MLCKSLSIVAASSAGLLMLAVTGCSEDDMKTSLQRTDNTIGFLISEGDGTGMPSSTRTVESPFLISEDKRNTLSLYVTIEDNNQLPDTVSTRGARVTTENLTGNYDNNIGVKSYDVNEFYFENVLKHKTSSRWETPVTYYWPNSTDVLHFWAWAPKTMPSGKGTRSDIIVGNPTQNLSFSYTMQAPDATNKTDAQNQLDLLFAHSATKKSDHGGCVPLAFQHALAAVRFKVSQDMACTVNSVSLSGIKSTGNCTFNGSFTWSAQSSPTTFIQMLNTTVPESEGNFLPVGSEEATFMIIPQQLDGSSQTLTLNYTQDGESKTFSAVIPAIAWEAGKLYTYTITLEEPKLDIEVQETFTQNTSTTKENVNVKNTGNVKAYLRMMVVAYWEKGGKIAGSCDPSFTLGTNWVKGSDGFYYYRKAVKRNKTPQNNLFNSYTAPASPVAGAHLVMTVHGQGVEYDASLSKVKAAWGNDVPLLNEVEE